MKTYGTIEKDGIIYYHLLPWALRGLYKLSGNIQKLLWCFGISLHNHLFDECTPDFSCCLGK